MTIANDLLILALRNGGINGVGQTPMPDDMNDSFRVLNALINEWEWERTIQGNRTALPTFPNLTTDVPFWTAFEHVLLTTMSVRLRQIYALPPVQVDVAIAASALQAFSAINLHYVAPIVPGVPDTVRGLVFLALRMAGRINDKQSVADGSSDVNDAFSLLVMMLAQWQRKRWLVWSEQETRVVSTGADFYTIGPGQDFNVGRPDRIHAARVTLGPGAFGIDGYPLPEMLPFPLGGGSHGRTPNLVNIPLAIITAHEDWNNITIPDLKSIPSAVWYDSSFPVGRIHFYPVPPANLYEMHLVIKAALPVYASIDEPLDVPPEYLDAMVNNLAVRIATASGQPVSPFLLGQARASLETIKMANAQIPLLHMPAALVGRRGGDVSTWSGRGLDQAWTVGGPSVLS